ncbi:MAG: glycosyltransferase [Propionibacteriaceae bacterium]|jgi:1,2-diacylglycerol 3-beta-galactosyltransferase|nr:glycosyltransferase [Propionibacteriaceae bacterium]
MKRILFLFSDTGGGHRASANAIIEGLELEYPGQYETQMVDFLRYYSPPPLKYSPEIYPPLAKMKLVWKGAYAASNGLKRNQFVNHVSYPAMAHLSKKLIEENPADIIVSVHHFANWIIPRAMKRNPTPFVTVVTDMVSTHAIWYSPTADLIIVPTMQARNRGIRFGIEPDKLVVIGQPVSPVFSQDIGPKEKLRADLGWEPDRPVALLVGGGDGMGPLRKLVRSINEAELPVTLAVICGRNETLAHDLESLEWKIPHHIYGFTTEMPKYMKAADIFVTKAGPGSVSEAFICGLPIVMYSCMPGQEEGNVDYVLDGGAGIWAPKAKSTVEAVRQLATDHAMRKEYATASANLARPDAARGIARAIVGQLEASG